MMVNLIKAASGNINTRHGEDAGRSFPHVGIDIGWGGGTQLYAPASGWITWAWVGTYGNRCIIIHDDDTWSLIAHADEFFGDNGREVEQGEHIGTMGRTGGPWGSAGWFVHCHQEYHLADGTAVDPERYFNGSATAGGDRRPVEKEEEEDMAAGAVIKQMEGTGKNTLWHLPDDNSAPTQIETMDELRSLIATGAIRKVNPAEKSIEMQHIILPANDVILTRRQALAARKPRG